MRADRRLWSVLLFKIRRLGYHFLELTPQAIYRIALLRKRAQLAPKTEVPVQRVAFRLKLKPDQVEEYESAHAQVWPELLAKLKEVGISDYSIFRHGQDLFLYMRVEDFDRAWEMLDKDPVNQRWQKEMSRKFEPVRDLRPGERFSMMKEVFYME